MERRDFLTNIGQVAAFVCAGSLLSACSKSSSSPGGPLTADLQTELTAVGSAKSLGSVIVVRIAAGNVPSSFTALSLVCTHQGCGVNYDQNNQVLVCPCHGSIFNLNGQVLQGPAFQPLQKYNITISNNVLTVA